MNQISHDDEIDLFELMQTIWDGKWLITGSIATFLAVAVGFLAVTQPVYESKLSYVASTIPPFYDKGKVSADFQKLFFSQSVFDNWKNDNPSSQIVFDDIRDTEVVDGYVLTKDEEELLATLSIEKTNESFVVVRSNHLSTLNDVYGYADHINVALTSDYVSRAKAELIIIETRFKDLSLLNDNVIRNILSIDRYIVSVEKGEKVFLIRRPTIPEKVSPKPAMVLVLGVMLGGLIGTLFVLGRNIFRIRNQPTASA